jgi:Holliday junction resolvase RusA-like endonuclease
MVFLMPDARRTDLTNKAESVADLLVDNGIIKDDSWQVIDEMLLRCDGIDRKNPRVEITLIKERAKNAWKDHIHPHMALSAKVQRL